jgi:hypothetical protein
VRRKVHHEKGQCFRQADGVVTLSQIEQDLPTTANAEAWDFNDLTCCSIADIRLIALNVTTPNTCRDLQYLRRPASSDLTQNLASVPS